MVDRWLWSCVCLLLLAGNARCAPRVDVSIPQNGPVIIDTDAGVYDAMAILLLLAYDRVSVKAITCVRGNTDAITVAMNVQKTLNVVNRYDIPIHVGANYGLVYTEPLKNVFGKDGFGDFNDNNDLLMTNLAKGHAAVVMAKIVSENPGRITIICMGPLTNLAIACHIQPQLLKLAKRVLILGGSMTGVGTFKPGLEFNFEMDPEAAALVFNRAEATSSPIMVYPVETFKDKADNKNWLKNLLKMLNSPSAKFMARLIQNLDLISTERQTAERHGLLEMNLATSMMSPLFTPLLKPFYVSVETQGGAARGIMLTDFMNVTGKLPNSIMVLETIENEIKQTIKTYLAK